MNNYSGKVTLIPRKEDRLMNPDSNYALQDTEKENQRRPTGPTHTP